MRAQPAEAGRCPERCAAERRRLARLARSVLTGMQLLALVCACSEGERAKKRDGDVASAAHTSGANHTDPSVAMGSVAGAATAGAATAQASCLTKIAAALTLPVLPGAPVFEKRRAELLARAKGRPVLLLKTPDWDAAGAADVLTLRRLLSTADVPGYVLYKNYWRIAARPELARGVLLREGYLYAEEPRFAAALANIAQLEDLFQEPRIYIHRGEQILSAQRHRENGTPLYRYEDGPEQGRQARLLFLDRVSAERAALATPLHLDFTRLRNELGFDSLSVEQLGDELIVARANYGDRSVPSLFRRDGLRVELECEAIETEARAEVLEARSERQELTRVLGVLQAVIQTQIDESLPFDEPKTEYGQEDGKLRQNWMWAYRFGHQSFEFNEDRYRVFDRQGRPRVPQVCVDFITDTLERASGTWYRKRGEPRERVIGALNLNDFGIENRRSVESFVAFTESRKEFFDVWHLAPDERIKFRDRPEFFAYLSRHARDFRPGDIVTIHGLRDDELEHYHSFFIYESDPITGMPIWLASNAGRPHIRAWENELSNAPRRSIKTRIRPQLSWLKSIIVEPSASAEPAAVGL